MGEVPEEYTRARTISGLFTVCTNVVWGAVGLCFGVYEMTAYAWTIAVALLVVTLLRKKNNNWIITFLVPTTNIVFGVVAAYLTGFSLGLPFVLLFIDSSCTGNVRFSFAYKKWNIISKALSIAVLVSLYILVNLNILVPRYTLNSVHAVLVSAAVLAIGMVRSVCVIIQNLKSNRSFVIEQREQVRKSSEETLRATEKLLLEEREKNAALRANEKKSIFLANMSHEIRTPLNVILGMNELILMKESEKEIREYAGSIEKAGNNLLELLSDILDLSKIEAGEISVSEKPFKTMELTDSLKRVFESKTKQNSLSYFIHISEGVPEVIRADFRHINQMVSNFIVNACKYTKKGSVSLSIDWQSSRDSFQSGNLVFTVEDTGIGMTQEDIEHIYDKFSRFDSKQNRYIEGSGLGMAIAKELSDALGAVINITSEKDKGTKVVAHVPVKKGSYDSFSEESDELPSSSISKFTAEGIRVLIVDDAEINLMILSHFLEDTLMKVKLMTDSVEAAKIATTEAFDLIILDHMMPDVDGIDVLRTIRAGGPNKDIPIMVLTANAVATSREYFLNEGFNEYISKPVDVTELRNKIVSLLPKDRVSIQNADK